MKNKNGCYVNIDIDVLAYILNATCNNFSNLEEKLELYVEGYKNHGISDLIFNVFGQSSVVPTKVVDWFYDTYSRKVEDGKPVDYTNAPHPKSVRMAYDAVKDPMSYMMDVAKKDFNVWLSYRMNDCHHCYLETSELRSETLYYHAKKNGGFLPEHLSPKPYHGLLNYADEHIRSVMLDYIRETLFNYPPYGIELDFLREPFCFDYEKTPEACEIMTDLMTKVKDIVNGYEKEHGKKVKILVRLVRDIDNNKIFGFDVREWIKRGLVDVLSPCSRWSDTDSDMPISEWKALCEGTDVEIAAGLEFYLWNNIKVDAESARGLSAQYFDEGADKIYLYNHYREAVALPDMTEWNKAHPGFKLFEEATDNTDDKQAWNMDRLAAIDRDKIKIWEAAENLSSAKSKTRRHVLTFTEPCLVPKGGKPFMPLPLTVEGKATLEKLTGDITDGKVTLYLGVKKDAVPPKVTVDGSEAKLVGKTRDAYFAAPEYDGNAPEAFISLDYYAYEPKVNSGNVRSLEFFSDSTTVEYLEFKVEV